jgi:transposase-like protein
MVSARSGTWYTPPVEWAYCRAGGRSALGRGMVMTQRADFVERAPRDDANMGALCRAFGITPRRGHRWLKRFRNEGETGLHDRSHRPKHSPRQSGAGPSPSPFLKRRRGASRGRPQRSSCAREANFRGTSSISHACTVPSSAPAVVALPSGSHKRSRVWPAVRAAKSAGKAA